MTLTSTNTQYPAGRFTTGDVWCQLRMNETAYVAFLQWALPRLGMRWAGFRRVRGQVRKRIARRLQDLDLADLDAYRELLEARPDEWKRLDSLCRVSISRFYRDRGVFDFIAEDVLPELVHLARERDDRELRCWSIGCASGEEPYTIAALWDRTAGLGDSPLTLRVLASDSESHMLEA